MRNDTTPSTALRAANGICRANGAATNSITSKVSEWIIPATGVCAPQRTFAAVRAITPVVGIPPKIPTVMFAMPCAINS